MLYLIQLSFVGQTISSSPSWVTYKPQAEILNKKISIVQTSINDKWFLNNSQIDYLNQESNDNKL